MGEVSFFRKNGYYKYPRILQIEITTRCGLHCPQCYKNINAYTDLDYEWLCKTLINQKKYGLKTVMLNGGEPLLYPNILELIKMMEKIDIRSFCFSSGLGITALYAREISTLKKHFLNISLNGSTEAINSLSRDGYSVAMQAIECLSNSNVSFGINWVARSDNLMDFPNIIKIAEKYNANNILVVGNKLSNNGILESPLTYSELVYLNSIISSYERNSNKIKIIIQQCYTELNLIHGMSSIPINNGCSSGRIFCAINCKKQFMPCTHLPYYEEYDSINEYWEKSTILKDLREFTPKSLRTCDACVYKDKCVFCRATNAITVADLKSEPISCIFNEIK